MLFKYAAAIFTGFSPRKNASAAVRLILVADDDHIQRKLARMRLQAMGFEIFEAVDGVDALAAIRRIKPNVVILRCVDAARGRLLALPDVAR